MAKPWLQTLHLWYEALIDHSNWTLDTGTPDEKKNDICYICALTKLIMILDNEEYFPEIKYLVW